MLSESTSKGAIESSSASSSAQTKTRHSPVVGVLGAGQLGRMLGLAAMRLGVEVRFASPTDSGPTRGIGTTYLAAAEHREQLRLFVRDCDVITIENEWAPCAAVARLAAEAAAEQGREIFLRPGPDGVADIADKLLQKQRLEAHDLPLGPYRACASLDEAKAAAAEFGFPVVLKRRRGAYDGYGNRTANDEQELEQGWEQLRAADGLLVESFVPFVRELAVLVARRPSGESVVYPVAHTEQSDHICAAVVVPAPVSDEVAKAAQELSRSAVAAFDHVGICAVELFELADGTLWVNELAPRPHNSGHYTIEACSSSQFDNHLRAILDLPLGDPSLRVPAAVMVNLLGPKTASSPSPDISGALALPGVSVHLYGKREPRPGRKLGHITVTGEDIDELRARAEQAADALVW